MILTPPAISKKSCGAMAVSLDQNRIGTFQVPPSLVGAEKNQIPIPISFEMLSPRREINPFRVPTPPPPPSVMLPAADSIFSPRNSLRKKLTNTSPRFKETKSTIVNPMAVPALGRPNSSAVHSVISSRFEKSLMGTSVQTLDRSVVSAAESTGTAGGRTVVGGLTTMRVAPTAVQSDSLVFTAPLIPSLCFPGRYYYGGKYYVPPKTCDLERQLAAEYRKYTSGEGSPRMQRSPVAGLQLGSTLAATSRSKLH